MSSANKTRPARALRRVARLIDRHGRSHTFFVTVAFCLFWVPVIVFAALAEDVVEREPIGPDGTILAWFYAHHTPVLDRLFLFATTIGQPLTIIGLALALIGYLAWRRRFMMAGAVVAAVGGAALANVILKFIFARLRPSAFPAVIRETGYSFPSGHSMVTSALVCLCVVLLWRTKWRLPALFAGIVIIFMVGLSRVYLGVHYPSDVLAGWSVGIVWAIITASLLIDFPFKLHAGISRVLKKIA